MQQKKLSTFCSSDGWTRFDSSGLGGYGPNCLANTAKFNLH